jgi:DNA-binding response OmpR family regulator
MPEKILLVDDNPTLVELLKTVLTMEGYQVAAPMDGVDHILEHVRDEKPDILLMDYFLGDCEGLDTIRRIRSRPETMGLRIIVISGSEKTRECLQEGADAFLIKPFMPEELLTVLRSKK